ncbi:Glyoxylate/hydroxypyruvate reductase A [Raoultella terrigena]|uniref:Glyoxylate/hydroxypyruvate reductase A n=1 Tax=Raoultella terrigena TaxID=577 RepID=A0A4U9D1M2_RAOTE|nr:Glyoxylate/hydroxypyruvate reductase A [Raoultella terrigena]
MFEYALWGVLWFQRHFDRALAHQRERVWQAYPQRAAADFRVGVMGSVKSAATSLPALPGWGTASPAGRGSEKRLAGVHCYHGDAQAAGFLGELDALINVLPLTEQTRGILARPLLDQLPEGAVLINCGRGEHMVNHDVLQALDSGRLAGALLDVFPVEPLPDADPLWSHPRVVITPHIASIAPAQVIARQLLENIQRQQQALPLKNLVDKQMGY